MFELMVTWMFSVGFSAGFVLWGTLCNAWIREMDMKAAESLYVPDGMDQDSGCMRRAA
jgi:hypothetical protein